jgi:MraZ protein
VLLGEFDQRLDAKNRVTLPAKFRAHFAGGVVLAKGWDPYVSVFAQRDWQAFVDHKLGGLDPFSKEARSLSRFLYGGAVETELDGQGRVMLSPALLRHAGLSKDIVVAGVRDHLEIWDHEHWRRQEEEWEGIEDVAERFAGR